MNRTILIYTRDEIRRQRFADAVTEELDGRILGIESAQELQLAAGRYLLDGVVIDVNQHDPQISRVLRALRTNKTLASLPAVFVHDETQSQSELSAEERANWYSNQADPRTVITNLAGRLGPAHTGSQPPPSTEEMRLANENAAETTMRIRRVRESARDRFRSVLDRMDTILNDDTSPNVDLMAKELSECSEILQVFDLDSLSSSVILPITRGQQRSPSELKSAIAALKRISDGLNPSSEILRIALVTDDVKWAEKVRAVAGQSVSIAEFEDAESLYAGCSTFMPEAVVIHDQSDWHTSATLQALRYLGAFAAPATFVVLTETSSDLPSFADEFGAHQIFGVREPLEPIMERVSEVTRRLRRERPHVVIVDEDEEMSARITDIVEGLGVRATVCDSAPNALRLLRYETPDLVFLRESYQGMSGLDICRSLRQRNPLRRIPVVFLQNEKPSIQRARFFEVGADDVMPRTSSATEIKTKTRSLVERARARIAIAETDELTGLRHTCGFAEDLESALHRPLSPVGTSVFAIEIRDFDELRKRYGIVASRSVLRSIADSLQDLLPAATLYRGWSSKFYVTSRVPFEVDSQLASLRDGINLLRRMTFRSPDGRGFYVTLDACHLLVPPEIVESARVIEALLRVQSRAHDAGSFISASLDPESFQHVTFNRNTESKSKPRWRPVVLTRKND